MKKYYADVRTKPNFPESKFCSIEITTEEFQGYISLITVDQVASPWFVPRESREDDCVLNNGYHWLAMYPKDKKYAVTAMINEKDEIVEWYFDMVASIGIEDGVPYMEDLYLDLVITTHGEYIVLDEEELEEALQQKKITVEEYEMALATNAYLLEKYQKKEEIEKLYQFTMKYFMKMIKEEKRKIDTDI